MATSQKLAPPLTAKQQAFVDCYVLHSNASLAAKEAGYHGNDETLRAVGYENLHKPHIAAAIERKRLPQLRLHQRRYEITQDTIEAGLLAIATDERANTQARVSAYMGIARMRGYIVDKSISLQASGSIQEAVALLKGKGYTSQAQLEYTQRTGELLETTDIEAIPQN